MNDASTIAAADLDAYASILVASLAYNGLCNASWWTTRAAEHYPVGSTAEAFAPHVLAAADKAGKLLASRPAAVCWERMPDGSAPVRLSFSILVF